jgi:hypothetical protein
LPAGSTEDISALQTFTADMRLEALRH